MEVLHTEVGDRMGPPPESDDTLFGTPDPHRRVWLEFDPTAPPYSVPAAVTRVVLERTPTAVGSLAEYLLSKTVIMPFSDN